VPEPLTLDEPLVRCEFMRMEHGKQHDVTAVKEGETL
jgi:acetoacetate decarboxylase